MFKYFLFLKGNNKVLAINEIETLWGVFMKEKIVVKQAENTLYYFHSKKKIDGSEEFLKRITFTNYLGIELFEGDNFKEFEKKFDFDLLKDYDGKKFCVRFRKSKSGLGVLYEPRFLAKPIWDSFQNPVVELENYEVEFSYIFYDDINKIHFCKMLYVNEKDYMDRMPKLRPANKPYTLKSDIARASLNLLGIKKGLVLDPFCGIGGILLEAYDLGFDIAGNDINWNDLKEMKKNFDYYYPKAEYIRTLADSANQFFKDNTVDGIVTDIPYGKSSRKLGKDLYEDFLKASKCYLKKGKRIIIIYANFLEFRNIALKYFDEVCEIEEYINKSMTRYILVLENNK